MNHHKEANTNRQKEFTVTISNIVDLGHDTYLMSFAYDRSFSYKPGQYVWVKLPKLTTSDTHGDRRAFSIIAPKFDSTEVSILFRSSESGYYQSLLQLKVGDEVVLYGAFGSAYVPTPEDQHIVMFAKGIAVAPFLSILRTYDSVKTSTLFTLYYSPTEPLEEIVNELQDLSKAKGFTFCLLDKEMDGVTVSTDDAAKTYYICGAQSFVDEVYNRLSPRVPFENMRFEQNYPTKAPNLSEKDFVLKDGEQNIMIQAIQDSKNHVIVTDANGKIIFANKAAQKITGYTFDEMRGNTPRLWGGLMKKEDYKKLWHEKTLKEGYDGEITNRRKDGTLYTAISHISPIIDNQGHIIGFIGTEEDITGRILIEQELLEKRNQILDAKLMDDAMLQSIGEGIISSDENGQVVLVNDAALQMLGYSRDELQGKEYCSIIEAENERGELITQQERTVNRSLALKKKLSETLVYIRKDGSKFISSVTVTPIISFGRVIGTIQVFRDITDEKNIDRMKSEFISLASHQLRTPLSAISWYLEMLINGDAGSVTEEQLNFLKEAYQGSRRMNDLVNSLLNAARIEAETYTIDPTPTDLDEIAKSVICELRKDIESKMLSTTVHNEVTSPVQLDKTLTRIIVQNLISNAVKYTREKGFVKVEILNVKTNDALLNNEIADQDYVLIKVSDNGMGIPSSQKDHIFLKLFRADNAVKSDTEGTGLGLYIVKSIVEQNDGKILFTSKEDHGSIFSVYFPKKGMSKRSGSKKLS